jgi:hypothetical protein
LISDWDIAASVFRGIGQAVVGLLNAIQQLVSETLKAISWAVIALVVLLLYRDGLQDQVPKLLDALRDALRGGGVSFDAAGRVKFEVAERAPDPFFEQKSLFSRLPFEIDGNSLLARSSTVGEITLQRELGEIAPQIEFEFSDYISRLWAETHPVQQTRMEQTRTDLREACARTTTYAAVVNRLLDYVRALEAVRFHQANEFAELLSKYDYIRAAMEQMHPRNLVEDCDTFLILHAAGIGYGQRKAWASAKTVLDKLVNAPEPYLPAADSWLVSAYLNTLEDFRNTDLKYN